MTAAHISAHDDLRRSIGILRSEYGRLGIVSSKIENATYCIETILGAQLDTAMPGSWVKYNLTQREGRVFDLLFTRKGECISREMLHSLLYAADADGGPSLKVIDVFVCRLRDKLDNSGLWIEAMWGGLGWRLRDGKGPARTNRTRQTQWEGLWIGTRQAQIAQMLKDSLDEVVPHAAFKSMFHYQPSACISTLRAKLKGHYLIEAVPTKGYRMTRISIPKPVYNALDALSAAQ